MEKGNRKYKIEFEGKLNPLKKWMLENHQHINGYVYNELDITHTIENKLKQLGWNSIYDELNHWQILTKSENIFSNDLKIIKNDSNSIPNNSKNEVKNKVNELNNFISHHEKSIEFENIRMNLEYYLNAIKNLKSLGVIKNKRDFTSQIGEWFVSKIVNGNISENGIQKDWDLKVGDIKIQVKSHSKALSTSARWTDLKSYNKNSEIDYLAILVFDEQYKIQEFYFLNWEAAYERIRIQKHNSPINWSDLNEFRVDLNDLNDNYLIKMFT